MVEREQDEWGFDALPEGESPEDWAPTGIDVTVPSIARVYDAILGGKNNFAVDRRIADEALANLSNEGAWHNRHILARGVRYLAAQGIDQFVDLGSGLPTVQNTHEVAQEVNPDAAVVYVDNDPIVLAHGRALLADNHRTRVVTADLRDPADVLARPELRELIDFTRPVGLLLVAVLHHLADDEDPAGVVRAYRDALPPGSYIFITHFCDSTPEGRALEKIFLTQLGSGRFRPLEEIESYFDGLELVDPGVVLLPLWHPDEPVTRPLTPEGHLSVGGIGRLPG
ncbi:SAM-dependent methyltransferase [Embleya sp. MST-111070]|uniref:SAM-dependent methyltransferase n=1 Tax=Embleya sp. MST-111070 TaxID=3398231 RepID=UPI003F73F5CC